VQLKELETFLRLLPDIIKALRDNPIGLVGLVVLVIGAVTIILFRRTRRGRLIGFLIFVIALVVIARQMIAIYPEVKNRNERDYGPQSYDLQSDMTWRAPVVRVADGTVINTRGHRFAIEAERALIVGGTMTIRSFPQPVTALPPQPSSKPQALNIPDAPPCQAGRRGNPGLAGEGGAAGLSGNNAGTVTISAKSAEGTLKIINTGMDGGEGGKGGDGGKGGTGQRGGHGQERIVHLGFTSVAVECRCGGAPGGQGGTGGDAGPGGPGGAGGEGGDVQLEIEKADALTVSVDVLGGLSGPPGAPGVPGNPGEGGLGGGGEGIYCKDESQSRHGPSGIERGKLPATPTPASGRAKSGRVIASEAVQRHLTQAK